ncbi:MAG: hypothetical protein WD314_14945 [Trueperaceae bacterium]
MFGLSHPSRALTFTLVILAVGFVWGALSANVPALRNARSLPYLANNWAVALPVFVFWVGLGYLFAVRYLHLEGGGAGQGLRLGLLFASAAFLFDVVVVAGFVGQGLKHFSQPILWIAYSLLILLPLLVGRTTS